MVSTEIKEVVRAYGRALTHHGIRVTRLVLFGSFAAGTAKADSDIDVAVISPDFGHSRFEEGALLHKIARRVDVRISPVPLSSRSFDNDTWVPLIFEIRKTGIRLRAA